MMSFASMAGNFRQAASAATGNQLLSLRLVPRYFLDFVDKHAEHDGVVDDFIDKCAGSVPIKMNHERLTNGRVKEAFVCDAYQCLKAPCMVDLSAIDNAALRQQIIENPMSVSTSMGIDFVFNKADVPTIAIGQNKIDYLKSLFANDPELRIVEMTPLELSIMDGQLPALPAARGAGIRLNFGDRTSSGVKVQIENEINKTDASKIRNNNSSMTKEEADVEMEDQAEEEVEEEQAEEAEEEAEEEEAEEEEAEEEKPKAKKRAAPAASKKTPPPKKQIKLNSGKKAAAAAEEEAEEEEEEAEEEEEEEKPKKKIALKKKEVPKKTAPASGKKAAALPAKKTVPVAGKKTATAPVKKTAVAAGGKTTTAGKKAVAGAPPSKDAAKLASEIARNADTEALLSKFKSRVQQRTLLHHDILSNADDINAMDIFDDDEMSVLDDFVNSDPLEWEPKNKKEKLLIQNAAFLARNKGPLADKIIDLYEKDKASQTQESKKLVKPSEANAVKKKAPAAKKAAVEDEQEEADDDNEDDEGDRGNPMSLVGSMLSKWEQSQLAKKNKEASKPQLKPKPFAKKK